MSPRTKSALCLLALLAILAPARAQSPAEPAPELALKDLSGAERKLSDYKGKLVVVNFWATWCVPCRKEMPSLVKLQNELGPKGVQVVAVTVDTDSFHDKVVKFAADNKLNFPVWFGSTANMEAFGLDVALPATVVVDREGRVAGHVSGMIDEAVFTKELEALLAK